MVRVQHRTLCRRCKNLAWVARILLQLLHDTRVPVTLTVHHATILFRSGIPDLEKRRLGSSVVPRLSPKKTRGVHRTHTPRCHERLQARMHAVHAATIDVTSADGRLSRISLAIDIRVLYLWSRGPASRHTHYGEGRVWSSPHHHLVSNLPGISWRVKWIQQRAVAFQYTSTRANILCVNALLLHTRPIMFAPT